MRGQQSISKYNETARNVITVDLAIIRLPQYQTDILISMNSPLASNVESSSSAVVTQATNPIDVATVFQGLVTSLTIHDFNLFNG